jgi:hypothetical protein
MSLEAGLNTVSPKTEHIAFIFFREKKDAGYDSFVKNGWNGFHKK